MKKERSTANKTPCWTPEAMHNHVRKNTDVEYRMAHIPKIMQKWGYAMTVPAGRHVNRTSNSAYAGFRRS